jgi:hypothetical protein
MAAAVKHVYLAPLNLVFLQCHRVAQYIQIGIVHSPAGHAVQQATAGVSLNALLSSSKSRSVTRASAASVVRQRSSDGAYWSRKVGTVAF